MSKTFFIDILHPAHVHFFKNLARELESEGHKVIITARDKEISIQLLEKLNFDYHLLSRQKNGLGLALEMITRTTRLILLCLKYKPDLLLGIMGPSIAVAGFLLRIPRWIFYDTENAKITNWFAYPLANKVYTPICYRDRQRKNEIRYPGYHELAYLHPELFTPDKRILMKNNIDPDQTYVLIRFVGWQASHDVGEKGLSDKEKIELVEKVEKYATVYISSESGLPEELKDRVLKASMEDIHHILGYARLVIGESATMASEAAVLGVKAFFISDTKRGYTLEQEEKYNLVKNYSNDELPQVLKDIDAELSNEANLLTTKKSYTKLISEKINTSQYVIQEIKKRILK